MELQFEYNMPKTGQNTFRILPARKQNKWLFFTLHKTAILVCFILSLGLSAQSPQQPASASENTGAEKNAQAKPDPNKVSEAEFKDLIDQELDSPGQGNETQAKPPSWGAQILKTTVVLMFMIGAFYLVWKFLIYKRDFKSDASSVMRVLYSHNLSPGKTVQILELGNRLLVIGNSDAGLQLITEIDEKPFVDKIKLDCDRESEREKPDFWIELSKTITSRVKKSGSGKNIMPDRPWDNARNKSRSTLEGLKKNRELFEKEDG